MPRKKYNKLVRDKIPDRIRNNGEIPEIKSLSGKPLLRALIHKILEEAAELQGAKNRVERGSELSDLLELLKAIARRSGIPWQEVEKMRRTKLRKSGGFSKGIFLKSVDEK